jgi:ubiquinone/menaquinone biosynthesis C-methylase UbiE
MVLLLGGEGGRVHPNGGRGVRRRGSPGDADGVAGSRSRRHTEAMQAPEPQDRVRRVARTFEAVADDYDQSGVAFFRPIASRLVALLRIRPGERVLDVGCGRGAVTLPAAAAAGDTGSVTAVDLSPAMAAHTRAAAERGGFGNVSVAVLDATRPSLPQRSFDVLAASLVLFFAPDPAATLAAWLRLVRPGGRVGVTTFGEQDEVWKQVDDLFRPYLPPGFLDPRVSTDGNPFATDATMERLMEGAGGEDVRTVREPFTVHFEDAEQWRRWSMGTGQRAFWGFVPEAEREALFGRAADVLEQTRDEEGRLVVRQDVRHTLAGA